MYKRIEAELILLGISKKVLANKLGLGYNTLLAKLRGERDFTLKEAWLIKQILKSKESIEDLFYQEFKQKDKPNNKKIA